MSFSQNQYDAFAFYHPFTMLVAGPTSSGKTEFVKTLIRKRQTLIKPEAPQEIIWFYSIKQQWFSEFTNMSKRAKIVAEQGGPLELSPPIQFVQGFNTEIIEELLGRSESLDFAWSTDKLQQNQTSKLLVFDDLMSQVCDSSLGSSLFYEGSHHRNFSIILLVQNLFYKNLRTISLNSQYVVIFKNPRETSVAKKLIAQSDPKKIKSIDNAFRAATENPYSYFLFDFRASTPEELRYLSNVLGEKDFPDVYKVD